MAQQLRSLIKSVPGIMRQDLWLNGGLDGLPILTSIMFPKSRHVAVDLGERAAILDVEDEVTA